MSSGRILKKLDDCILAWLATPFPKIELFPKPDTIVAILFAWFDITED